MNKIILTLLFCCGLCLLANMDACGADGSLAKGLIFPGENFYGVNWNSNIKGVLSKLGTPDAIITLTDDENKLRTNKKMLVYGKKHLFFFSNDKIYKISLGFNWLPFEITDMFEKQKLDGAKWDISNLLKEGMSEKTLKAKLGRKLQESKSPDHYYVDINNYIVFLTFAYGAIPRPLVGCSIFKNKQDQLMFFNKQQYSAQKLIDEKNILGVPYGSSRAEVIKYMKAPQGEFNFANNCTGLLYGKYIFILKEGLLNGVYINNLDYKGFFSYGKELPPLPEWSFLGLDSGSSLNDVTSKLGKYLKKSMSDKIIFSTGTFNITIGVSQKNTPNESVSYLLINCVE